MLHSRQIKKYKLNRKEGIVITIPDEVVWKTFQWQATFVHKTMNIVNLTIQFNLITWVTKECKVAKSSKLCMCSLSTTCTINTCTSFCF